MTLADIIINKEGFNLLSFDQIHELINAKARQLMGEDIDLGDESPLGQWTSLLAYDGTEFSELLQQIYLSNNIDTATGDALTMLTKLIGVSRLQASKSFGNVTFSINPNTVIPKGFVVETETGFQYVTDLAVTSSTSTVQAPVTAVVTGGAGNVSAGKVNRIGTPQAGVLSVINNNDMQGGSNTESDQSLRARYYYSLSQGGSGTADAIRSAVLAVAGVRAVRVIENDKNVEVNGLPPKSFETYVLGGEEQTIANAIGRKKSIGIQAFGNIIKEYVDEGGNTYEIGLSRPESVPIEVRVELNTNSSFETGSEATVKDNIIAYIGGTDSKGNFYQGLSLGDDVISYKVILASGVAGVVDVNVKMSRDEEALTEGNVTIENNEVATINLEGIEVIVL